MFKVSEIANRLRCSVSTVYALITTGEVPRDEVALYAAAADVEGHDLQGLGFGMASLEMLAAGVPVVSVVRADNYPTAPFVDGEQLTVDLTEVSRQVPGYFNSGELTWGLGSRLYSDDEAVRVRKALRAGDFDIEAEKEAMRFIGGSAGNPVESVSERQGPANISFGVYLASCEGGDIRQSPQGLLIYDDEGKREVPLTGQRLGGNGELMEMYRAIREGGKISHDGRWGMATLELIAAIMQSGRERREIMLTHQCPAPY